MVIKKQTEIKIRAGVVGHSCCVAKRIETCEQKTTRTYLEVSTMELVQIKTATRWWSGVSVGTWNTQLKKGAKI